MFSAQRRLRGAKRVICKITPQKKTKNKKTKKTKKTQPKDNQKETIERLTNNAAVAYD